MRTPPDPDMPAGAADRHHRRAARRPRRARPPLDRQALDDLALGYVGRYATTRARLRAYLERKLAERGWADGQEGGGCADAGGTDAADAVAATVARLAELRYVDDRAFAEAKGAALGRRGFGTRRIGQALKAAGVAAGDAAPAREQAQAGAWAHALAYARRRRIGPFADRAADPDARRRAMAAMLRAGHDYALARRIVDAAPGAVPERDDN